MFLIPNFTTKNRFSSSRVSIVATHTEPTGKFGSVWSQAIYSCTVLNRYKDILLTKRKNNHKIVQL